VDVLLVTTKATGLAGALERVAAPPGVVVPLLNGVEHMELLHRRYPAVAAGVIRIAKEVPMRFALLCALVLVVACHRTPPRSASVVVGSAPACWKPSAEDFSVTAAVADTTFHDSAYARTLLGAVIERWQVPVPLAMRRTDVSALVHRDGRMSDVKLHRRSYYLDYDQRAERAVKTVADERVFDSLPLRYHRDSLPVVFRFGDPTADSAVAQFFMSFPKPPQPEPGNPMPEYPEEAAREGVTGRVTVTFLVDSMGAVDTASVRVLDSPHPALTRAVLDVLPRWHFKAANLRGCRMAREVRYPFDFSAEHRGA
jgi:TonB family protein